MTIIVGTCHFVSLADARSYYREYGYDDVKAAVARKLADGEIRIGKPDVRPGERVTLIDEGRRYAIEARAR